ncbi:MAG: uroporphyrinogen decarboxylase family protein, partial [Candidatus Bathyarchaeia archaeon]
MVRREPLTSLERIVSAVDFEEPDRIPTIPLVSYALSDLIGCTVFEYCHDAKKLSDAVIAGHRRFGYDAVIVFADVYLFAEAVGLRLEFPENSVPKPLESPILTLDDAEKLEIPDVRRDGRLPVLLEAIERVSREFGDDVALYSGGQGPFSLAAEIRGLESFLKDLYVNRPLAEKLIRFSAEYMIELGRAEVEAG